MLVRVPGSCPGTNAVLSINTRSLLVFWYRDVHSQPLSWYRDCTMLLRVADSYLVLKLRYGPTSRTRSSSRRSCSIPRSYPPTTYATGMRNQIQTAVSSVQFVPAFQYTLYEAWFFSFDFALYAHATPFLVLSNRRALHPMRGSDVRVCCAFGLVW